MIAASGGVNGDIQLRKLLGVSEEVATLNFVERASYKTNNGNESPYNKEYSFANNNSRPNILVEALK